MLKSDKWDLTSRVSHLLAANLVRFPHLAKHGFLFFLAEGLYLKMRPVFESVD